MAIAAGADAVGLVSRMPSGPGPIPESTIEEIVSTIPPGVDVCSGVRTDGLLDERKLSSFMEAVRMGDAAAR